MYLYRGGGCRPHISLCRLWAENAHLQDVREAVFDGQEKLNKNIELSLGFIPLRMAKTVTAFIDEPEVQETRQYLDRVSRVDVGVYESRDPLIPNEALRLNAYKLVWKLTGLNLS